MPLIMNKSCAAVVAAVLTLGLAACGTTAPGPTATDGTGASSASPTTPPAETPSPAASAPAPTSAAPAPGTPEAAVWEALMGPHGEYHAAASYAAVIEEFGPVQPYTAIKETEERHINALSRQLGRFGVEVPANPYLGEIDAPPDLETAANAWAEDEVANVAMYDELLTQVTDPGLKRVFTNLRRASLEAHLPLFEEAAANGGTLTEEQMVELGHIH